MVGTSGENETRGRSSESTIVADGKKKDRRPKKRWEEVIKKHLQMYRLNIEDAQGRRKWKKYCSLADPCKQEKNAKSSWTNG